MLPQAASTTSTDLAAALGGTPLPLAASPAARVRSRLRQRAPSRRFSSWELRGFDFGARDFKLLLCWET
jgi:hypothetical protein